MPWVFFELIMRMPRRLSVLNEPVKCQVARGRLLLQIPMSMSEWITLLINDSVAGLKSATDICLDEGDYQHLLIRTRSQRLRAGGRRLRPPTPLHTISNQSRIEISHHSHMYCIYTPNGLIKFILILSMVKSAGKYERFKNSLKNLNKNVILKSFCFAESGRAVDL